MGIAATFQQAAVTVRQAFGDVFESADFLRPPARPDYDATSGSVFWHNPDPPALAVPTCFAAYTSRERIEGGIPSDHIRAYVAALDLGLVPGLGCVIRRPDGSTWSVVNIVRDPAGALYDLQLQPWPQGWPLVETD